MEFNELNGIDWKTTNFRDKFRARDSNDDDDDDDWEKTKEISTHTHRDTPNDPANVLRWVHLIKRSIWFKSIM